MLGGELSQGPYKLFVSFLQVFLFFSVLLNSDGLKYRRAVALRMIVVNIMAQSIRIWYKNLSFLYRSTAQFLAK